MLAAIAAAVVAAATPATIPDAAVVRLTDNRAAEWRLSPAEKRFDQVGWAADLMTARRLAATHDRPVFLFTMDGRVNTGRC